ncbi:MAG: hypothetical protein Q8N63_07950 [Nanoarchaeota archaeon]|nr:hypothetical protein [Nanoarchaeota archaeon]
MEMQLLTRETVTGLDIICASYVPPTRMPEVKKIEVITESHTPKVLEEHADLSDFRLLGTDLDETIAPYISKGQPVVDGKFIKGMRFWNRNREVMRFLSPNAWPSMIGASDGFVYFGQGRGATLLMFDKPIHFDSKNDFLYIRSPNGKFIPRNVLVTMKLEEKLTLGEWIILEKDRKKEARDYHFCDESLCDLYYQGKFKSLVRIYDSVDGIILECEEGGEPIMKKNPGGLSWSPVGEGFRPVRKFSFPKDISTFNPLTFNPSQHQEVGGRSCKEKGSEREYSLVYANPAEITSLRWGFNSGIMEPLSGGISRYHNQHLF